MKKVKVVFLFILIFSGFLLVACQANYIRDVQGGTVASNFIIACRLPCTIRDSGLYSPACSSGVAVELSHGRLRWMP
ncbi:colicin release lysis protein, partial [Klebsiella pneumoniae]|nr:colicin release lysis protein [Klebsiella pneumoniae]